MHSRIPLIKPGPRSSQNWKTLQQPSNLTVFIETRTLQHPSSSEPELANEIGSKFGVNISRATINLIREGLRFMYDSAWHDQVLNETHKTGRVEFCQRVFGMRRSLAKIHFADEVRVVLGNDKRWTWHRNSEDNLMASASSIKYPPSVIAFAVIGISFKSDLMIMEGSINTDWHTHNLDHFGFIDAFDEMHALS
jgi:hypothetical protein